MKKSQNIIASFLILSLVFLNSPLLFAQSPVDAPELAASPDNAGVKVSDVDRGPISVHFSDVDIQTVLRVLAMKGGVNIVTSPAVQGKVTIDLENVTWKNVLDLVLRNYGYTYVEDGNIIQVFAPAETSKDQGSGEISSEAITLEYASLSQVKDALNKTLPSGNAVESIKGSNQILIRGTATDLRKARNLVSQIDRRLPQVHIDAKIIRTALGKDETMGINWSTIASFAGAKRPTTFPFAFNAAERGPDKYLKQFRLFPQGLTETLNTTTSTATGATGTSQTVDFASDYAFPYAKAAEFVLGTMDFTQFTAVLNFIQKRDNTKMISNPKIVVLDHQQAMVTDGGTVGIPKFERNQTTGAFEITGYDEKNEGVTLTVNPHITKDRLIDIDVRPVIAKYLGCEPMPGTSACAPRFMNTEANTRVLIHSGDTLMIGGFIMDVVRDKRSKIPFLNRIPILGWFTKYFEKTKSKDEVVFFITVNIVDDVFNEKAVAEWQKEQADYEAFQKYSEKEFFKQREKKKKGAEPLDVKAEAAPAAKEEKAA